AMLFYWTPTAEPTESRRTGRSNQMPDLERYLTLKTLSNECLVVNIRVAGVALAGGRAPLDGQSVASVEARRWGLRSGERARSGGERESQRTGGPGEHVMSPAWICRSPFQVGSGSASFIWMSVADFLRADRPSGGSPACEPKELAAGSPLKRPT